MKSFNFYFDDDSAWQDHSQRPELLAAEQAAVSILIQVFTSIFDAAHCTKVATALRERWPTACLIGATTGSEILDGQVTLGSTAVSVTFFAHTRLTQTLLEKPLPPVEAALPLVNATLPTDSDHTIGHTLAQQLTCADTRVVILFGCPEPINIGELLDGFAACKPDLAVAGGSAANALSGGTPMVFDQDRVSKRGVVGVALHGESLIANRYWHLSWQRIGKVMTATRTDGNRLYELDHIPAMQMYQRYFGDDIADNFYQRVLGFPLIADRDGLPVARIPHTRLADGSLMFGADVRDGEKVRFGFGNVPQIISSNEEILRQIVAHPVESIFVYSCVIRRAFMQEAAEVETRPLQALAPTAGFFTFGEYFNSKRGIEHLNATMTVLALAERCDGASVPGIHQLCTQRGDDVTRLAPHITDPGVQLYMGTLSSLTSLVNAVTGELEASNRQLAETLALVEAERAKSDRLLRNILPVDVATELKELGYTRPRLYERVTVLFTDIKGFTVLAERLSPEEIIAELDHCFLRFDEICERFGLERIKTIGDAYMAAGGVPTANVSNPFDVVAAALEMQRFMSNVNADKQRRGAPKWSIRIGVHTGPVVAGVVGKRKFAYDIWGDAVNIAARMEQHGEVDRVNVSGETYRIVAGDRRFRFSYRGRILAKNKGEVDMYFVDSE